MAKKTAARKKTARKSSTKKPALSRRAPALPPGAVRADVLLEERHVRLLEALGRAYGLPSSRPDLAAVVREVLDRYGHRLLKLATPRRGIDEEE